MKRFLLLLFLFVFVVNEICSQITRDTAYVRLQTVVLDGNWEDKEIASRSVTVQPHDTIRTVDSFVVAPQYESWLFFVDELPAANWGHKCKYVFISCYTDEYSIINMNMPPSITYGYDLLNRVVFPNNEERGQLLNISRQRNVATANNEYAVIISGGADSSLNYSRYWNDCSAIYKILVNYYGYDKNKIFVLMANGPSSCYNTDHPLHPNYSIFPNDLDGDGTDDINYSATSRNVGIVFDSLSHIVTDTDNVFIFVTDHGDEGSTLSMWYGRMTKEQFATEVNKLSNAKTINICMEQCYSSGYVSALAGERRVIATACAADENSWPRNDGFYDEFCYHWISAVIGATPNGTPVNADYNNDGYVSMDEAFYYATTHDTQIEMSRYYSNRVCLGEVLTLNGVSNETCIYPDLYIRDSVSDDGSTPSDVAFNWDSPDIWLEDLSGNRVEKPAGNTYYNVCVRIHNRSDYPSLGKERLFLNWAKAGISDYWYENWTSHTPLPCNTHPFKGGVVGSPNGMIISSMPANGSKIEKVLWLTPRGEYYEDCQEFTDDPWHFCLLARVHDDDTIAHENEQQTGVYQLVRDNNNVAQKNIYLNQSASHKSVISISNPTANSTTRYLRLLKRRNSFEEKITDFAEVSLAFDAELIFAVNYDLLSGAKFVNENTLLITDEDFVLPLQLTAGQYSTLSTSVNFLTNKTPQNDTIHFDIVAYTDENFSEITGGQGFKNVYAADCTFHANAGNDTAVLLNTTATLHATQINENATYRWYDKNRNFLYEGVNFSVLPLQTSEYILEVTALGDGYRDLDTVKVNVLPGCIRSITPNPVGSNWVVVSYEYAATATSAQLLVYNIAAATLVGNYDLSNLVNAGSVNVEVANYPASSYTVVLVCDNTVCHSKTLIRQ